MANCLIDGTVRPISQPEEEQRLVYNGCKCVHTLKFNSLVIPNGLIANLFGPVEGCRHDAGMLSESGLLNALQTYAHTRNGNPLCIYGDLVYPLCPQLMCPCRQGDYAGPLTPQMRAFNALMSSARTSVAWLFGDVSMYFQFIDFKNNLIDFKKNLKIGMSAVGKQYT